ncbi:hypothetical protein FQR65_LT17527 [Abscondita terminalis]|nr:hypothetical protein FQR65_LT17527 [Abscondita terminalis]
MKLQTKTWNKDSGVICVLELQNTSVDTDYRTILSSDRNSDAHLNMPDMQIRVPARFVHTTNQEDRHHSTESSILNLILSNVIALKTMLQQQNQVLCELRAGKTNKVSTEFDLVPKKPFSKLSKLLTLDQELRSNDNVRHQVESDVYLLGGSHKKEHIKRGLKTFFSDRLATKCSWTGRKSNFCLKDTIITEILKQGVRKRFPQLTDADFQLEVSAWFRQATLRLSRTNKLKSSNVDKTSEEI